MLAAVAVASPGTNNLPGTYKRTNGPPSTTSKYNTPASRAVFFTAPIVNGLMNTRRRLSEIRAPSSRPRPPPPDVRAVIRVRRAELRSELRLLEAQHEEMERGPDRTRVPEERGAPEQQAVSDDRRDDRDIHGVPDVPIQPGNHETSRRSDRGRRAEPYDGEPHE